MLLWVTKKTPNFGYLEARLCLDSYTSFPFVPCSKWLLLPESTYRRNRGSVSAPSAGANTKTLYVMVDIVKGVGVYPHPHQAGLIFPSWWNIGQIMAICTLWLLLYKRSERRGEGRHGSVQTRYFNLLKLTIYRTEYRIQRLTYVKLPMYLVFLYGACWTLWLFWA